jgi:flagellar protein FlaG
VNIQFSLFSASSTIQAPIELHNQSNTAASGMEISNIKTTKEIYAKERQGVQLSMGQEQLIRNIERAVKALQGPETILDFNIHEKTHDIMVKVLNKETGEVIREIPPEKTLDLVAKMMEIAGIMVDEKV